MKGPLSPSTNLADLEVTSLWRPLLGQDKSWAPKDFSGQRDRTEEQTWGIRAPEASPVLASVGVRAGAAGCATEAWRARRNS